MNQMPKLGLSAKEVYQIIREELRLDGDPALNLGTFSTSFMEAEAFQLLQDTIGKNFIDSHAYPNIEKIHQRVIRMLGQLFNVPSNCLPMGTATTGSSEALMLALLAHKFTWRKQREKEG